MEKVQRKAACWVKSKYSRTDSVTRLLEELKWAPLADRRRHQKLCLFHKIHTSAVNLSFSSDFGLYYVTRTTRAGSVITEDGQVLSYKLNRPRTRKTPLSKSTIISTIPIWNSLPGQVIAKGTANTFRRALERLP